MFDREFRLPCYRRRIYRIYERVKLYFATVRVHNYKDNREEM